MDKQKTQLVETRLILNLAFPAMVEFGFQTILQYIDLYMVGTLGVKATSVVGLCSQVQFLLRFPINGMAVGVLAAIAFEFGNGKKNNIQRLIVQTKYYTLIWGILFWILSIASGECMPYIFHLYGKIRSDFLVYFRISYSTTIFFTMTVMFGSALRAVGDMRTPMLINGFVNLINIVLNYLFMYKSRYIEILGFRFQIFGAGMGLAGTALGTAISIVIGGVMTYAAVCRKINIKEIDEKLDRETQKRFLQVGISSALSSFVTGFGRIIFTSIISKIGIVAVAAHSVAYTVESFFYIPAVGIERAATTLSGNYLGQNDIHRIKKMAKSGSILIAAIMAGMGFLLFLLGGDMSALFTDDINVERLSKRVLRIISVNEPLFGLSVLMQGILDGMGKTKQTFLWSSISMWMFRVFICFFIVNIVNGSLEIAWICMVADNVFRAISLGVVFYNTTREV